MSSAANPKTTATTTIKAPTTKVIESILNKPNRTEKKEKRKLNWMNKKAKIEIAIANDDDIRWQFNIKFVCDLLE